MGINLACNKIPTWKFALLLLMLVPAGLFAQAQVISGTITDAATGVPLPGVTVVVKGTTLGSVSDFEGNYTIQVPPDATLQFTYVGYGSTEEVVGERTTIDARLGEVSTELDEIVVIGYGV